MEARMAMMAMTTKSSMSVNDRERGRCFCMAFFLQCFELLVDLASIGVVVRSQVEVEVGQWTDVR